MVTVYKFNGKELDQETGMYYYGARYYSPDLSIWASVDPLSDKYPSMSPFMYCAGNPVRLVDPDGNRIFAVDDESKKYMMEYFKDQLGSNNMFKFNKHNELKINRREYRNYLKNSGYSSVQKDLLRGVKESINESKIGKVNIKGNSDIYSIQKTKIITEPINYGGITIQGETPIEYYSNEKMDGSAKTGIYGSNIYILMNNDKSSKETYEALGGGRTGNSASSVFMHELLDEFLDHFCGKDTNDPIKYHNKALNNKGLLERSCHEE